MVSDRVSGKFEVVGREWKRIYLFVNEDNEQIKVGQGDRNDALILASFLDNIKVGEVFPTDTYNCQVKKVQNNLIFEHLKGFYMYSSKLLRRTVK